MQSSGGNTTPSGVLLPRGTFFRAIGPEVRHPHFFLSDPSQNPDQLVIANFTSRTEGKIAPFVMPGNVHPALPKDSVIAYGRADVVSYRVLIAAVQEVKLEILPYPPLDEKWLNMIAKSCTSDTPTPVVVRNALRDHGLLK